MTDRTSGPPKSVATTTALTSASTPDAVPGFRFSPLDVGGEAETRPSGETASDAAEVRGALLGERARAFLGVLALENGHAELRVETERLVLVQTLALADGAQDRLDGERAVRRDHRGQFERLVERLAVRDDVPDEPDFLRLGCLDVPSGQQQI